MSEEGKRIAAKYISELESTIATMQKRIAEQEADILSANNMRGKWQRQCEQVLKQYKALSAALESPP